MFNVICSDVCLGYNENTPILSNFNYSFSFGKSYAIIGSNGTGKSTFIKTLIGYVFPMSGKIIYQTPTLNKPIRINIEAGTIPGKLLRVKNKGITDLDGYKGDLVIKVNVHVPKDITEEEKKYLDKLSDSDNFKPDKVNLEGGKKKRFNFF